jgi:hypothetical protein
MTPFLEIAGWTLIHFLWQGTAIGLATALALKATARRSANVRYIVACAGLALMLAAPVATARLFSHNAALWNGAKVRLQPPVDVAQGGPEALEGPDTSGVFHSGYLPASMTASAIRRRTGIASMPA